MPVPTGKASQQDFSRFHKPVWPKSHTLHKKPSSDYPYATREELDNEKAGIDQQHRPLKTSHDGTGRLAGTQGRSDHAHPDDQYSQDGSKKNEPDDIGKTLLNTLEDRATEGKTEWSNEEVEKVKDRLRKAQEIGKTRDEALKELYDDESFCFSIREVKQVVKDWKLEDPLLYGAARYVLPTTEKDIKGQNWPGKAEQEAEKAKEAKEKADEKAKDEKSENDTDDKKQENKDDKKTDDEDAKEPQSETSEKDKDQKASPGDDDKSNDQENGESFDDLSEDEQEWYGKLMKEMDQINGLQNNPGIPSVDFGKHGLNALKQKYKVNDGSDEGKIDDVVEARQEARLTKVRDRAMEVQVDDQFTPDSWIPRSSHLLRLTGKHPMNAEPPMSELFNAGLITPTKLHYIRNHGAVPKLAWETHTLEIFSDPPGLLDPAELSMDEIAKDYKAIEIPVTLACTGARREEVNRVKKSGGFGWSAAAVSTCMWTGALVRDILLARNMVEQPEDERWYLNYEGADEPSEGKYATSIPLSYAMDPVNDVMLAYGINGAPLHPDHGYPLRSLIPSFVGGRCVKWLKKIWISKKPNDSHYHIWDNRVVPSFVTSKQSRLGKAFFHSPSTIINEQCLQSVIVKPAHGQYIPLQGEASGKQGLDRKIKVEGFAYHGGGHPVERVELSVDGGENWRHCFRTLPEKALRHGNKFWTWLFWECEVTVKELANAEQVIVRAFDVFKTSQPEHITWNITGMMNNSWYRVKPELTNEPESDRPAILFHHPVPPGAVEGGWMKPSAVEQAKEEAAKSQTDDEKQFTLEEVQKHNTPDDAWIIIDNKVYDVTSVLSWHPGGAAAITNYAGKATVDTTVDYNAIHDDYANSQRDKLLIGRVSDKGIKALAEDAERSKKVQAKLKKERAGFALKASSYSAATLVQRKEISKDTRVYTFSLPKSEDGSHGKLGLPIGNHIQIAFHLQDGVVTRPYTPIRPVTADEEDGTFDLLIKSYFPGSGTKFPPGGTLSNYVDVMKIGEDLDIRLGPSDITYLGKGKFKINDKEFNFEKINLVAGGSGLTPHWQLIHSILKNSKEDKTAISLVDANSTFGDVLMFDELKKYGESHSEQFKPWFTLSKKPEDQDWPYTIGHLDEKIIKEHFWAPEEDKVGTFLCGPPGLIQHGAMPALKNWGFEEGKNLFGF